MIGLATSFIGLAGTALAFVKPDLFTFATYASVLGGAGVLVQSFLARGWYDDYIDPTDPTQDTVEELDDSFADSKNYLLFGGLVALAIDAYVIAMPLLSGQPEAPAEESEIPTDEAPTEDDPTALFSW